jgi:hypothetical protein
VTNPAGVGADTAVSGASVALIGDVDDSSEVPSIGGVMRECTLYSTSVRRALQACRAFVVGGLAFVASMLTLAPSAPAITNGASDGSQHPYVGESWAGGNDYCTGSLISPTVYVTAAHCSLDAPVFGTDPLTGAHRVALTFDPVGFPNDPTQFMNTTLTVFGDYYIDPRFTADAAKGGLVHFDNHDLGVVILDAPIPSSVTTTFAALPALGEVDTLPQKTALTLVGYGIQGFDTGGGPPQPLQTFTRDTVSSALVQSNDVISAAFLKMSTDVARGNGGVCNGDSGGPDLLGTSNVMLAENSFVMNAGCHGVTYSNRLDTADALSFIQQTVAAHTQH